MRTTNVRSISGETYSRKCGPGQYIVYNHCTWWRKNLVIYYAIADWTVENHTIHAALYRVIIWAVSAPPYNVGLIPPSHGVSTLGEKLARSRLITGFRLYSMDFIADTGQITPRSGQFSSIGYRWLKREAFSKKQGHTPKMSERVSEDSVKQTPNRSKLFYRLMNWRHLISNADCFFRNSLKTYLFSRSYPS